MMGQQKTPLLAPEHDAASHADWKHLTGSTRVDDCSERVFHAHPLAGISGYDSQISPYKVQHLDVRKSGYIYCDPPVTGIVF